MLTDDRKNGYSEEILFSGTCGTQFTLTKVTPTYYNRK